MSHQVALLRERLPAHTADVWTPVRVLSHVPDELVCSREPLPTHFAPERPLARVPPLVLHQACLLREGTAAYLAPERLLPRVDPLVPGHVGSVAGVRAEATLVLASFPPVHQPPVRRQVTPRGERCAALGAGKAAARRRAGGVSELC